ncbi:MAG: archaetidylserine decarboxylase [Pseudomonadota bacterium]
MTALFIFLQHLVPHHAFSRLVGFFANSEIGWIKTLFIMRFIKVYDVNMAEALDPDPHHYASFNAFFTRALAPGARPMPPHENAVVCPADGGISAIGKIHADTLVQAKKHSYSVTSLLGGDAARAAPFQNGEFFTVYLSPRDYHRVHIPLSGTLREMVYVPGRLFSVNQTTADNIPDLFALNERAVCIFETAHGPMAVVLVGAMIVAGIETVWAGQVAPASHGIKVTSYTDPAGTPIYIEKGMELGRFMLGSTAIVLFGPGMVALNGEVGAGDPVRLGQQIATLLN